MFPLIHLSYVEGLVQKSIHILEILQSSQLVHWLHSRLMPLITKIPFCLLTASWLSLQLPDKLAVQRDLSLNREVMLKMPFHYRSLPVRNKVQQRPGLLTKLYINSGPWSIRVNRVVSTNRIIKMHFRVTNMGGGAPGVSIATWLPHWINVNYQGQARIRRHLWADAYRSTRLWLKIQQQKNTDKCTQRINIKAKTIFINNQRETNLHLCPKPYFSLTRWPWKVSA